jgi:putative oxidoreductase
LFLNIGSLRTGRIVQRLFSTFPEGWPGAGLAFLRAIAAIPIIQHGIAGRWPASQPLIALQTVAACAAALLLAGLWTPAAGVTMAAAELCLAFSQPADPWLHVVVGALGIALAMLGPGAWSVDARLFGRKRIQIPQR